LPWQAHSFEQRDFPTAEQESLFRELAAELRCLVCQNQNIADSNAELAQDLRREISQMILDGDKKNQIIEFMVARYGEFVLYKPRLNASTIALWVGPLVFFLLGLWVLLRIVRGGSRDSATVDDAALERARELLDEQSSQSNRNG
jgi:cytochrome c-type biogenesis protein CcmH